MPFQHSGLGRWWTAKDSSYHAGMPVSVFFRREQGKSRERERERPGLKDVYTLSPTSCGITMMLNLIFFYYEQMLK